MGTAFEVAGIGENNRPTAFLIDVDTVLIGNPKDPFWVGGEDGSHFPRFQLGDRIVVARWAANYEDPAGGTSDLSGCFWVVMADGQIDYSRSPSVDGLRPSTLARLLTALSGQPNTALDDRSIPPTTLVGLLFLALSGLEVVRRRARSSRR